MFVSITSTALESVFCRLTRQTDPKALERLNYRKSFGELRVGSIQGCIQNENSANLESCHQFVTPVP